MRKGGLIVDSKAFFQANFLLQNRNAPQPPGFADGPEVLGTIGGQPAGSIVGNDTIELTLGRTDATDYLFSELNQPPHVDNASLQVPENSPEGTVVGTVTATDPENGTLTYSIVSGNEQGAFALDAANGQISVADGSLLDFESTSSFTVEIKVADPYGGIGTATVTVDLLNQASITGEVFVDANQNGLYDANELGIEGVVVELLDASGAPVLDGSGALITATSNHGGIYLFEDLDPGTYQLHEIQPAGVDDGAELLGSLGGSIPADDTMQLTLARQDAFDYVFTEIGQQVASGDTATIGFWHNKHGQDLIVQGGFGLGQWLTDNFGNVFGSEFEQADGWQVAQFYRDQVFRQLGNSGGPAKVDAQFMAVALATYFTNSNLAGTVATDFGFSVTDTGIGTKVVNVGSNGAAFGVADGSSLFIMQLLLATNDLTDVPDNNGGFVHIYDRKGDGQIDAAEALLRAMANDVYSMINEAGKI